MLKKGVFKDGTYLAKAAFPQHLVEHQVVEGEVYPGGFSGRWSRAHALTRRAIATATASCYTIHTIGDAD